MNLVDLTLTAFGQEVASLSPAPGGGSVAAYAGAQGFALVAMVCRLTIGRPKFATVEAWMQEILVKAEARQADLLGLVDQDTEGFKAVMRALGLPKQTEEEKFARRNALERATLQAAEIPLQTAKLCLEGLRLMSSLLDSGNPNALSDMGVASLMFQAGLEGALYNVQINANDLREEKQKLLAFVQSIREEGSSLAAQIHGLVQARLQ